MFRGRPTPVQPSFNEKEVNIEVEIRKLKAAMQVFIITMNQQHDTKLSILRYFRNWNEHRILKIYKQSSLMFSVTNDQLSEGGRQVFDEVKLDTQGSSDNLYFLPDDFSKPGNDYSSP